MDTRTRLLFICSGNLDRSPTAEDLFKNSKKYEARSAGTHPLAVRKIDQKLLDWADLIFVMSESEDGHLTFLKNNFAVADKKIYDLEIPDRYGRGNPVLVKLLKKKIGVYLPDTDY